MPHKSEENRREYQREYYRKKKQERQEQQNKQRDEFNKLMLKSKVGRITDSERKRLDSLYPLFKKEFKDTKYIKKSLYKEDLDICRHFGAERVFFYDLKGFLGHYGWEGIEELGLYNLQKDKWYLEYNNSKSIIFVLLYCGIIFIDMFVFFEKNTT